MVSANARLAGLAAWVDDFIESVATFCNTARVHQPTWRLGEIFSQSHLGSSDPET